MLINMNRGCLVYRLADNMQSLTKYNYRNTTFIISVFTADRIMRKYRPRGNVPTGNDSSPLPVHAVDNQARPVISVSVIVAAPCWLTGDDK